MDNYGFNSMSFQAGMGDGRNNGDTNSTPAGGAPKKSESAKKGLFGGKGGKLSFSFGSSGKNKVVYPEKEYFNLSEKPKEDASKRRIKILIIVLIALLVLVGFKFLVYDKFKEASDLEKQVADTQTYIEELDNELGKYDQVTEDYHMYAIDWMSDEERLKVDRLEILRMIDTYIMSAATVHDISVSVNSVSLNMSDINLSQCYDIVYILQQQPYVADVTVYTANSKDTASNAMISMVIGLMNADGSNPADTTDSADTQTDDSGATEEGE